MLIVPLANLRPIVDGLLLRFAAAGLLQHFSAIAEFVCRLIEGRTVSLHHQADDEAEEESRWSPNVQHSQWMDLQWLWVVYLVGNSMAAAWFGVGVLLNWWASK